MMATMRGAGSVSLRPQALDACKQDWGRWDSPLFLLLTFLLSFMGLNMLSKMAINSLLDSCDLVALTSQNAETTDVCCNAQLENEFVDDTNIPFMRK